MSATGDAYLAIQVALGGVAGMRVYEIESAAATSPGGQGETAAIVSAPSPVLFETFCSGPTSATYVVTIVAGWVPGIVATLLAAVEATVVAIETGIRGAAVTNVVASIFAPDGTELPCYQITVECPM